MTHNNPFKNYKPGDSALVLEQTSNPGEPGVVVRCQIEGMGRDIVHLIAVAINADTEKGGVLKQMILDALEISLSIDNAAIKMKVTEPSRDKKVIN